MRNTGKPSEKIFENHWKKWGKKAFCHRLVDAAEVFGRVGKIGLTRSMPSDYLVTFNGETFFAEVKSTESKTSFAFSLLKTDQINSARMIVAAGGLYYVFIHSLEHGTWYRIPIGLVFSTELAGRKSLKWEDMKEYEWKP